MKSGSILFIIWQLESWDGGVERVAHSQGG